MSSCIFCKIINKEIPTQIVFENEKILAFKDVAPQAPIHILFVPKKHIKNLEDCGTEDFLWMGDFFSAIQQVSRQLDVAANGYRCVINTNSEGGQSVYHLHIHLMAGKQMGAHMTGGDS